MACNFELGWRYTTDATETIKLRMTFQHQGFVSQEQTTSDARRSYARGQSEFSMQLRVEVTILGKIVC
jgi:hypothetical protein